MATTYKCCIVTKFFTVWIHPMLTRCAIERLVKELGIFEPSVLLCAVCKSLSSHISRRKTHFLSFRDDFLAILWYFVNFIDIRPDFPARDTFLQDELTIKQYIHQEKRKIMLLACWKIPRAYCFSPTLTMSKAI